MMTRRRGVLTALLAVAAACAVAAPVGAAGARVGVVDLQRCLNESKLGKQYKAEFTGEAEKMKAALEEEEASLKELREQLEKQGLILSETARAEKEREYKEKVEAFKEKFKASQQTLQRRDQELTRKILKELRGIIQEIGDTEEFDLIVERGEGGVLYAPGPADLTSEVIRRYDKSALPE